MQPDWSEVQYYHNRVQVARQNGALPQLQPGEALLKILACGICGSDVRVVTGNKTTYADARSSVTLGHEGVGRIMALADQESDFQVGDFVVILPHQHIPCVCEASTITPFCIGNGHTRHMGWDSDGCFTDFMRVPVTNIVRVESKHIQLATAGAAKLGSAIFSFVEPMLCVLSAYKLIQRNNRMLSRKDLTSGRALVIGCGPIGILHSLILLDSGFEVWLMDTVERRIDLAQWCLDSRVHTLEKGASSGTFDLVMVTASNVDAIRSAETLVCNEGIIYLFAGLNAIDRSAMDRENIFSYERLHRTAKGIRTTSLTDEDKSLVYMGHSGYFEELAPQAIAAVAFHAAALDRAVTGIIPGLGSSSIHSRLPGGVDWATSDDTPAIISVLGGLDLRERHCKLLLLPSEQLIPSEQIVVAEKVLEHTQRILQPSFNGAAQLN